MHLRHDAMAAAAEWIVAVEDYAAPHDGLVATVGRVEVSPGAGNVIAGQVTASLDVRHADDTDAQSCGCRNDGACKGSPPPKRGVQLTADTQLEQPAVPLNPHLTDLAAQRRRSSRLPEPQNDQRSWP